MLALLYNQKKVAGRLLKSLPGEQFRRDGEGVTSLDSHSDPSRPPPPRARPHPAVPRQSPVENLEAFALAQRVSGVTKGRCGQCDENIRIDDPMNSPTHLRIKESERGENEKRHQAGRGRSAGWNCEATGRDNRVEIYPAPPFSKLDPRLITMIAEGSPRAKRMGKEEKKPIMGRPRARAYRCIRLLRTKKPPENHKNGPAICPDQHLGIGFRSECRSSLGLYARDSGRSAGARDAARGRASGSGVGVMRLY
ncbi:hypothetical protein EVAR_92052_1 [Eumeta japonica]|uniref:Uncharacterized protein n=1 Tax=Eumeta variegata TaxID=151549 RepID=A0A4C1T1J1_EUMVA|nr:hypothetical protein EVAR_92052_1 [Eumeta japonica]